MALDFAAKEMAPRMAEWDEKVQQPPKACSAHAAPLGCYCLWVPLEGSLQ